MSLIILVNFAFSLVGFFVIFRMWRTVKSRRDYYGENFTIPRGEDRSRKKRKHARQEQQDMSLEDVEDLVNQQLMEERKREEERRQAEEDRQKREELDRILEEQKKQIEEQKRRQEEEEKAARQVQFANEGDLQRMIAAAVAAQMEGMDL